MLLAEVSVFSCVTLTSYFSVESDTDSTLAIVGRHGNLPRTPRAVGVG
jgi:hypothetical protein